MQFLNGNVSKFVGTLAHAWDTGENYPIGSSWALLFLCYNVVSTLPTVRESTDNRTPDPVDGAYARRWFLGLGGLQSGV